VNGSPAVLTYAACGLLIVVYASGRFNTPPSNRSSTRQTLYWWSCAGYVLSALALFARITSRTHRNWPVRLMSSTARQSSGSCS
jgi:hypothetical protein